MSGKGTRTRTPAPGAKQDAPPPADAKTDEAVKAEVAKTLDVTPDDIEVQGDEIHLTGEAGEQAAEGEQESGDPEQADPEVTPEPEDFPGEPNISFDEYVALRGPTSEFDRARLKGSIGAFARPFDHWEDARTRVLGG